jgi:DNA repair photolyase
MALKKQVGNMYDFVTHMWAPVRGKCKHDCSYCYMKRFPLPAMNLNEQDMKTRLGEGNVIFVCHTADLFADDVPAEWIKKVLLHCNQYPKNRYLFQSKNSGRFAEFDGKYPVDVFLGTTIETNRDIYVESKAPSYMERAKGLQKMNKMGYETMVTIEPIFDFDLDELVEIVITANPAWINIGADSKKHGLPEPSKEQIKELINVLQSKTDVKLKDNLKRIMNS